MAWRTLSDRFSRRVFFAPKRPMTLLLGARDFDAQFESAIDGLHPANTKNKRLFSASGCKMSAPRAAAKSVAPGDLLSGLQVVDQVSHAVIRLAAAAWPSDRLANLLLCKLRLPITTSILFLFLSFDSQITCFRDWIKKRPKRCRGHLLQQQKLSQQPPLALNPF